MKKAKNGAFNASAALDLATIWQGKKSQIIKSTSLLPQQERHLFKRFTSIHQDLAAQPRKLRRRLTRKARLTLADIALMLTLGIALPANAQTILVDADIPTVNRDGLCSLMEAINNANNDSQSSRDCPAGSGADTIVLESGSTHIITKSIARRPDAGLTAITSNITIEGNSSTINVAAVPVDLVFNVGTRGDLTLKDTTISGNVGSGTGTDGPRIHNNGMLQLSNVSVLLNPDRVSAITNAGLGTLTADGLNIDVSPACTDLVCYTGLGIENRGTLSLHNTQINNLAPASSGFGRATAINNTGMMSLNGVSISNGYNVFGSSGIFNEGSLTGTGVSATGNSNYEGFVTASIFNSSGADLTLEESTLGGGLTNNGTAAIDESEIGGGGTSNNDYLNITDSTVTGCGLFNQGELVLERATVTGHGGYRCGSVHISNKATIHNSTIINNNCYDGSPVVFDGDITITNSTLGGNYSYWTCDGVVFDGNITLSHSIIAGPVEWGGRNAAVLINNGVLNSEYNLFGDSRFTNGEAFSGFTPGPADITATSDGTNPTPLSNILELGVHPWQEGQFPRLADNGGPTQTVALVDGSPAIDAGQTTCEPTDQRGISRPQGPACDLGSYEFEGDPPVFPAISEAGVATVNHNWTMIAVDDMPSQPVIIAGPPSFNGGDPGVARIRNVRPNGFDMRFQEWDYRDGWHTKEQIPFLVAEAGKHEMPDGSIWEAGLFPHTGTPGWSQQYFSYRAFPGIPRLFLTIQTNEDTQAVTARARNVTARGFEVGFFEQQSLMDGHGFETVGYLAIYSPSGSGGIDIDGVSELYDLRQIKVDEVWKSVLGKQLKLEEEKSQDNEIGHILEEVDVMGLGSSLFGQVVSSVGRDPAALRQK